MKRRSEIQLRQMLANADPDVSAQLDDLETALARIEARGDIGDVRVDALPPAESILARLNPVSVGERAEHVYGRSARLVEFGRNVLTLMPLIVTWWSLGAATYNYGRYEPQPGTPATSFLELWERDFPGQKDWTLLAPTFSGMARWAVFLLILLALFSFFHFYLAQYAMDRGRELRRFVETRVDDLVGRIDERRRGSSQRDLRAALAAALAAPTAELIKLTGKTDELRTTLTTALAAPMAALTKLSGDIAVERDRLADIAARRDLELTKLSDVSTDLKDGVGTLIAHAETMRDSATRIEASTTSLQSATNELKGLRTDLQNAFNRIIENAAGLASAITAILTGYDALRSALKDVGDELRRDQVAAAERAKRFEDQHAERLGNIDLLIAALTTQHGEIRAKLNELIKRVPAAADIATEVTKVWGVAQETYLTSANERLEQTLLKLPEQLDERVVKPILGSSLITRGEELIAWHSTTVAQLDGALRLVHDDAERLAAALRAIAAALGVSLDDRRFDIADRSFDRLEVRDVKDGS